MYYSQVEALWALVTLVLKVCGTRFQGGEVGAILNANVLQSA